MSTCRKSYKEKLKPTPAQERALENVLWRCRTLYNTAIEQRRSWRERGELDEDGHRISANLYQQKRELPDLKQALPEYAEVNSQVLQDVMRRVDRSFQNFFRRVKNGDKKVGYPRFQGRDRYHSFTYPAMGNGVHLEKGREEMSGFLLLTKIGRIGVRWSRPIEGTIKTVTISKEADGWYVIFSCAEVPTQPLPLTGAMAGIDVGLKVFLVTSDGLVVENPRCFRNAEKKLRKAQRHVARCKKGSKRRKKAVALLAKHHQKVRRQRQDHHHKTARMLVDTYDTIYLEDLQVSNMVRNRHLAKSISDAGWATFRTILACKAEWAGKRVIAVPARYTSQDCSGCGERVPKSLSVRTHICPACGLVIDRDENAALNILQAGRTLQAA